MKVWRLCQSAHQSTALSGEGARRYGGRWNFKGQPALYTSSTLSLATLEALVHVDTDLFPAHFIALEINIPNDVAVETCPLADLPATWREDYPPSSCQAIGGHWLEQGRSAVLVVPSAIIPEENNVILNPRHADFAKIQPSPPNAFVFDSRLWRRR